MNAWIAEAQKRLVNFGFVVIDNVDPAATPFAVVTRRTRFELTKFGFSESFFIFREFDQLTAETLRAFSADAFRCAKKHRAIPLPCGFMESVWCYSVAVCKIVDEPTVVSVRTKKPPMHWASAEIPVVYDMTTRTLAYFEETPLWGAAYYAGFRKQIKQVLGEVGRA